MTGITKMFLDEDLSFLDATRAKSLQKLADEIDHYNWLISHSCQTGYLGMLARAYLQIPQLQLADSALWMFMKK